MPKKHNKYPSVKPASTVHPSLESSSSSRQHGSRASASQSVNDLIQHLRRTQVPTSTNDGPSNPHQPLTLRTLHPSLRNILDVPETPPPRPRPNARPVGGRLLRRIPGPPPPSSWLQSNRTSTTDRETVSVGRDQVLYRLERLPGINFPPKHSLQHVLLKSMATSWPWHLDYDNVFLVEIPNRLKLLLLSYIAIYSPDAVSASRTNDLDLLFGAPAPEGDSVTEAETSHVTRLDLSAAIGKWTSIKLLSRHLLVSSKKEKVPITKTQETVPESWDDVEPAVDSPTPPLFQSPSHILRFPNLRYLSLAHPERTAANWGSLVNLLSHISTITHLSLAHWPIPTLTPNSINARVEHPSIKSLTFAAGGTDTYSADENNWVEVVNILRKLSRATYCLKWLDLEGCGQWFDALSWDGRTLQDDEPFRTLEASWNGPWRDIEWIGLGPGWIPAKYAGSNDLSESHTPLVASIHSHSSQRRVPASFGNPDDDLSSVLTAQDLREAEMARQKQRHINEWKAYEDTLRRARQVERHVHRVRREAGGKWIHFSFGGEGAEEREILETVMSKLDV
ncbi:hypothetical protein UA08_01266 [Talaromyces atroroseus]|uniref:Tafazzin n=1 Tax=Talaromyces atroroseus TaxID=1441469 RepID=A0A1Q5QCB6_TALAT|nr:hypothetical protein UA08_01266 [Talaromyces atroroseus]OKL63573.1 hypothetical protein UA08_01266 [Talaromyces atroroseus]